jgi:uncharacterized protein
MTVRTRAMLSFLVVYLAVYGGVHLYLWWKVRRAFHPAGAVHLLFICFLLLMLAGPILSRQLEKAGFEAAARPLAFAVYTWMAVAFWAFCLGLAADGWNLAVRLAALRWPEAAVLSVPARPAAFVSMALILAAILYGTWEARDIRLTRISVTMPFLFPSSRPVRVAQISDLHIGLLVGEWKIRKVAELVNEAGADLVVSTGDLVDGGTSRFNHLAEILAGIRAPLGKYAVTGNHEYYAGLEDSLAFTQACGFRVLRGESAQVGPLIVAGVDDPASLQAGLPPGKQEDANLPPAGAGGFVLLLKHRPEVRKESAGRFGLQLSGHTHRGQIWPFTYLVALSHRYLSGLYDLGGGSSLFISRGTGTWGPPLRLCAPPEVTLIELRPAPGAPAEK